LGNEMHERQNITDNVCFHELALNIIWSLW
jgi:hypothetical protein